MAINSKVVFEDRVQIFLHAVQIISTQNLRNGVIALAEPFFGLRAEKNEENYKWEWDKKQRHFYEPAVGKSFSMNRETRGFAVKGRAFKRP